MPPTPTVDLFNTKTEAAWNATRQLDHRTKSAEVAAYDALVPAGAPTGAMPDFSQLKTEAGRDLAVAGVTDYVNTVMSQQITNWGGLSETEQSLYGSANFGGVTPGKFAHYINDLKEDFNLDAVMKDQDVQMAYRVTTTAINDPVDIAREALVPAEVIDYANLGGVVDPARLDREYQKMGSLVDVFRKNEVVPRPILDRLHLL